MLLTALAKAQQLLLDPQEREYLLNQINAAKGSHINLHAYASFSFDYVLSFLLAISLRCSKTVKTLDNFFGIAMLL